MVPVELSVKVTVKGFNPLVGLALKAAIGRAAATPVTIFVLLPPSLEKRNTLLKLPELVGANRTEMLVTPNPARVNVFPDREENGPGPIEMVPLVMGIAPMLVTE